MTILTTIRNPWAPCDNLPLLDKPNTKVPVWRHFGFRPDGAGKIGDIDLPTCKCCSHEVPTKNSNTTNLYTHLKNHHPDLYEDIKPTRVTSRKTSSGNQVTISESFERSKMLDTKSREHKELTSAITRCIAKDMLPISVVEKDGFKAMVHRFNPRYQLPSRKPLHSCGNSFIVYSYTRVCRAEVEERDGILCLNYRFVELSSNGTLLRPLLSWDLQTFCLQSQFMPQDHSGLNIKECLEDIQQRWNLSDTKLVALTTDSSSNIKLACQLAGWKRLSCFGHNLDLAVKKGLMDSRIDRVAAVCRKIVTIFNQSWKRQRDMATFQEERGYQSTS